MSECKHSPLRKVRRIMGISQTQLADRPTRLAVTVGHIATNPARALPTIPVVEDDEGGSVGAASFG